MQFARINDVAIHYQVIGGPAGKPVLVFVNSLGTDFRIWRDVIIRLAGDFPILIYDKRGHGLSDVGTTPYRIEDHASDLAGLMDMLNISNTVICGLSVGGLIAQSLYSSRPDLVAALVLADTASRIGTADMWNARIAAVQTEGIESILDAVMERWFTPAFRSGDNAAFQGYRNMLLRQPAEGYAATCAAIRDADYTAEAGRIGVPVLCIVGDQDGSTPPDLVRATAERIPGARFEIITDAGHIPCIEQHEAMTEMIKVFIRDAITSSGAPPHG